ncbi:MAG: DUF3726 domain-containing protein [Candidatus Puniceispirillum sp.]|jgi:hypothetical protein|uniref:DUF3726 domain-containing protein n=1 Tax=Candidatus Puniceispirillum sp. TaxID=2026719 RepID=UPI001ED7226E|nr:DUF3726 domain-containing protein [Candidatus Puniceispirillum sp.]MBT6416020.1 DUF3726 domain-containing protein [Candidatus Puniceispirillum sp.]
MTDVSWSLGETGALALKAARGAGMSWGFAEEASHAVIWLAHRGAPGVASLCRHLNWYNTDASGKAENCPITIGAAISDGAIALPNDLGIIREPLLLVPFISACASQNGYVLHIDTLTIDISTNGFSSDVINTALLIESATCRISPGTLSTETIAQHKTSASLNRIPATASACIKTFEAFAHHTYAPSTEQSRLAGAGSGLSDND